LREFNITEPVLAMVLFLYIFQAGAVYAAGAGIWPETAGRRARGLS